jgi:hypothetical protein
LSSKFADIAAAAVCLAVFAYVAYRARTLPITHDEALTWWWHVQGNWLEIALWQTPGLPDNNHMLFTLLAKVSVAAFGLSELTLRLPTLAGLALFLAGTCLVLRRIAPGWAQVIGLLAIALNPYLVDFFTVARGYGLGLGLTMLAMALLVAAIDGREVDRAQARLALLLFALATLANLVYLLACLAAMAIVCAALCARANPPWKAAFQIVWPTIPILLFLLRPITVLRRAALLATGGTHGFWEDTVGSLVDATAYDSAFLLESRAWLFAWIVAVVALLPVALALLWKADRARFSALAIVAGVMMLVAVASVAQFHLFGVALLEGRRALVLLALFLICAVAIGAMPRSAPVPLAVAGFALGMVAPAALSVHNVMAMQVDDIRDWRYDAASREMMYAVRRWVDEHRMPGPATLRTNWIFGPSSMFYRATLGLERELKPLWVEGRPGYDGPADLYYVDARDEPAIAKYGVMPYYRSSINQTILFERKAR